MPLLRWLAFTWLICAAVGSGGCSGTKDHSPAADDPGKTTIVIAVPGATPNTPVAVVADGKTTVPIMVTGTTGSVTLTTTSGTFENGMSSIVLAPGATTATLTTCDSIMYPTCTGNVTVTATDTTGTKILTIRYLPAEICDNGADDDKNGKIDCGDDTCDAKACRVGGVGVDSGVPSSGVCQAGECVCNAGNAEICTDGMDNNCDGKADCADVTCKDKRCLIPVTGVGGLCTAGKCACPQTAENCSNQVDDDCDGLTDCADPDCQADAAISACAGQGVGTISITASQTLVPADGTTMIPITAYLRNDVGAPQSGQVVTFELDPGSVGTLASPTATTNTAGTATVMFTSSPVAGTASIRASYIKGTDKVTSDPIALSMPQLGQIKFVSQQYSVMGNTGSNYNETNDLVFQVLYSNTTPYPPGLIVNFTHESQGESFIGVTPTCSMVSGGGVGASFVQCTATATTDSMGMVHVLLHSGNTAAHVSVTASAQAGGSGTITATTGNIAIVGGQPSGLYISLKCTPYNTPALIDTDCSNSKYDGQVNCVVSLGDRFNNALEVPALVSVSSEAGHPGPVDPTPLVDPTKDPSTQPGLGIATTYIAVLNNPLPVDVPPATGEYSYMYTDSCGTTLHNPRDGLVTVIASTHGEEGFVDGSNGFPKNGKYDLGENFADIGEPYVDANDNNTRDNNEYYVDANTNGKWDPPNGVWDASTTIWSTTRIVYTGWWANGDALANASGEYLARWSDAGYPSPTPTLPFNGDGMAYGEERLFDAYLGDGNFNIPSSSLKYSADIVSPQTVSVSDKGTGTSFADSLGMIFSVQFCTEPTPGPTNSCTNDCRSAPCYVVTTISGYQYAGLRPMTVKCPTTAPPVGWSARMNATVQGVISSLYLEGTCGGP